MAFSARLERHGRAVEVGRVDGLALFVPGGLDGGGERADLQPQGLDGDECRMVVSGHGGVREAARRRRSVRWGRARGATPSPAPWLVTRR